MTNIVKDMMEEALWRARTHEMVVTAERLSNSVREMTEVPAIGICALLLAAAVLAKMQDAGEGGEAFREMFEGIYRETFIEDKVEIVPELKPKGN